MSDFGILMVCTGNICRSPMAEQMLVAFLDRSLASAFGAERGALLAAQVVVSSAGTSARDGESMTPESVRESERHGAGGRAHLAHRLTADDVRAADLILAMTTSHRSAVAHLDPAAMRRCFTLTEFARLLGAPGALDRTTMPEPDEFAVALTALVPAVAASRGYLPPATKEQLDIVDPYGRGARFYAQVGSTISEATTILAGSFVNVMRDT